MPPPIAAVLTIAFIAFLFLDEAKDSERPRISWAPFVWMFLAGSRFASYWLQLGSPPDAHSYDEGSPIDRIVFGLLIAWGVAALLRRRTCWREAIANNSFLCIYLLFCLASLGWSGEPYVLVKRWIKDLGNPVMALVLLTERRPYDAVGATLRRLSFVMLPLSVLFIKYYPDLGRAYTWGGSPTYTGIGHQKNDLGLMCLLAGTYYGWALMHRDPNWCPPILRRRAPLWALVSCLAWLLYMSNSQTSLVCLIMATALMSYARVQSIRSHPEYLLARVSAVTLMAALLEQVLSIKANLIWLLGRRPDLTNRAQIWDIVLRVNDGSWLGTGFMSFWTPTRTAAVARELGSPLKTAHNGYLEQYLTLGYPGVLFTFSLLAISVRRVYEHLRTDLRPALLRLTFISTTLLYNYTESAFYGMNNVWVLFLVAVIRPPTSANSTETLNTQGISSVREPRRRVTRERTKRTSGGLTAPSRRGAYRIARPILLRADRPALGQS
jgi:exopolysaccharide production protein ExoQ